MSTHEPGTVAEIRWPMTSGAERAMFDGRSWHTESGVCVDRPSEIRSLVVLDIPNRPTAEDIARVLRLGGYGQHADQVEAQTQPRISEPTEPLTEVMASTNRRERRKFVRGLNPFNARARWVDGVASWSWDELIDPTLIPEGAES